MLAEKSSDVLDSQRHLASSAFALNIAVGHGLASFAPRVDHSGLLQSVQREVEAWMSLRNRHPSSLAPNLCTGAYANRRALLGPGFVLALQSTFSRFVRPMLLRGGAHQVYAPVHTRATSSTMEPIPSWCLYVMRRYWRVNLEIMSKQSIAGDGLVARMHELEQQGRLVVGELLVPRAVKEMYAQRGSPPAEWLVCGAMPLQEFRKEMAAGRRATCRVQLMPSSSGCAVLVASLDLPSWSHHFCTPLVGVRAAAWVESLRQGDPLAMWLGDGQQDGEGLVAVAPVENLVREKLDLLVLPLEGEPRERAIEFWSLAVELATAGGSGSLSGRQSASLVIPGELAVHVGQGIWGTSQRN